MCRCQHGRHVWAMRRERHGSFAKCATVILGAPVSLLDRHMTHGSARFFIDPLITALAEDIVKKHGLPNQQALLLPSYASAKHCIDFLAKQLPSRNESDDLRTIALRPETKCQNLQTQIFRPSPLIVAVLFPHAYTAIAKAFWQHTGEGISSRRAKLFHEAFKRGQLGVESRTSNSKSIFTPKQPQAAQSPEPRTPSSNMAAQGSKGPHRYRKKSVKEEPHATPRAEDVDGSPRENNSLDGRDQAQFVEERFGRNLDSKLGAKAKLAIRRRIAGALTADHDLHETGDRYESTGRGRAYPGISIEEVYLYPTGMSSIYNTHRALMMSRGEMKSICFGYVFPASCGELGK